MSDEPYALSTPAPAAPPTETDYDAILAAVMETVRGRWFLAEFARRNRQTDTRLVLAAIERLEATLRGEREAPSIERIRVDIRDMARAIDLTKREIAAIKPDHEHGGRIGQATEELDSIVQTTEQATSDILAAAEQIQETAWTLREQGLDDTSCDQLDGRSTDIYLACSFQDLTGQRIRKVIQVLRYLEGRVSAMVEILGADEADSPPADLDMDGPFDGHAGHFDTTLDQAEIDEVIPATHAERAAGREHASELVIDHLPDPLDRVDLGLPDPAAPAGAAASDRPEPAAEDRMPPADELVSAHEPDVAPAWGPTDGPLNVEDEAAAPVSPPPSDLVESPEPTAAAVVAASADEASARLPQDAAAPASEFTLPDHSAPLVDGAPHESDTAEADAVPQAPGMAVPSLPPLETATIETATLETEAGEPAVLETAVLETVTVEPPAACEPPVLPEPVADAEPATGAAPPVDDGGAPAAPLAPAAAAAEEDSDTLALHQPITVDTQALLADLLAIIRPAMRDEAETPQSEPSVEEAEPATADVVRYSPDEDPRPGDAEELIAAPVSGAPESALPEPREALPLQTFAPPPAADLDQPTWPELPPAEAAEPAAAPAAEALAPADDATLAPDSSGEPPFAGEPVSIDHPDIVEPGILSAEFLIVPSTEEPADAASSADAAEAADLTEIGAAATGAEPAMEPETAEDADAVHGAVESAPAPALASALPDTYDRPVLPDLGLPRMLDMDVVAIEADDDIFMPLADRPAPPVSAPASIGIEQPPTAVPAAIAPATPDPQASSSVLPPVVPAISFYRAPPRGFGATTIEVPLAQAATTVELPVVSLLEPALPSQPGQSPVHSPFRESAPADRGEILDTVDPGGFTAEAPPAGTTGVARAPAEDGTREPTDVRSRDGRALPLLEEDDALAASRAVAVSPTPFAVHDMPARPAIELASPSSVVMAGAIGAPPFRPAARPSIPVAAGGPLAAIDALSVEEKIALFS